jgi:hypothetical protein
MILRRATQVVAGTTMPRSVTRWLPGAQPEGPSEAGIGQRRGCQTAKMRLGCQQPATGSHLPPEETASPCAVSSDFTATQWERGFASGLPCQAPSEGTPQSAARGTLRSRDRAAAGMSRPRQELAGAFASRCGVASSSGRDCSALRGRTIRVVAFRASHPAKPPSRPAETCSVLPYPLLRNPGNLDEP